MSLITGNGNGAGGIDELVQQVRKICSQMKQCRPEPGDDHDTLAQKAELAGQLNELLGNAFDALLKGLGSCRGTAKLIDFLPPFYARPMARVATSNGQEVSVCFNPDLLPRLTSDNGKPMAGLTLQMDMQSTTIVGTLDRPPRNLKPYRVMSVRRENGHTEIEGSLLYGVSERRLLAPAYCLPSETVHEGVILWAEDGFAYRLGHDDEEANATAQWQFDLESDVMPADVVGLPQIAVMGLLLLWAEIRIEPSDEYLSKRHNAVLLSGIPGNGKTYMVCALHNALRARLGSRLIARAMNAAEAADPYHGVTEANFRNFFDALNKEACNGKIALGLIDEFDVATGDRRSNLGLDGGVERRVVGTIAEKLNGIKDLHPNVLIVCTSNRVKQGVDSALKRRFQILDVPKLGPEALEALCRNRLKKTPKLFGGTEWARVSPSILEALHTEIGFLQCGTDKLPVAAHHCLSGAKAAAAIDRCLAMHDTFVSLGLPPSLTPENLAFEIVRVSAEVAHNMTVAESREFFVDADLVPETKASAIAEPPKVEWSPGVSPHPFHDAEFIQGVIERWSPPTTEPEA